MTTTTAFHPNIRDTHRQRDVVVNVLLFRTTHTKHLDSALNDTMRITTGCMHPTETTFLPVLAGITPLDVRRGARVATIIATAKF